MAATRGPVPKRSTERRRRNKVPGETTVHREGEVKPPSLPKDTHAIARRWYQSLVESGQSEFYEPSDWAAALYVAEAMTRNLKAPRFSAQMFGAIWSAMDDLLTTESARRPARVEVQRGASDEEEKPGVTAIKDYRKRLAK